MSAFNRMMSCRTHFGLGWAKTRRGGAVCARVCGLRCRDRQCTQDRSCRSAQRHRVRTLTIQAFMWRYSLEVSHCARWHRGHLLENRAAAAQGYYSAGRAPTPPYPIMLLRQPSAIRGLPFQKTGGVGGGAIRDGGQYIEQCPI